MKQYGAYKDSGVEWIGEIPGHWESVRLKFIGESIIGIIYSPDDVVNEGEGILVLRSSNIQDGRLAFEDCVFVEKQVQEKHLTKEGDILLCARNGSAHLVGKSAYIDKAYEGVSFGAFMSIVRSDLGKYLFYFFNSQVFKSQTGLFATSTINQLTSDTLNNMYISFPKENEEQTAIATYLDRKTAEIDALIADKKRLLELFEEEKAAIINQAVTKGLNPDVPMKDSGIEWLGEVPERWTILNIKYICQFIIDGTHGSFPRVSEGYRLLSVRNIINDEFVFREDDSKISEEHFNEISKRFLVQKGDIQLAIVGATLGKVAIVKELPEPFVTQRSVATLRSNERCLPKFLFYFIKTSNFQSYLWLNAGFSAQPGVYLGTIQNSYIPLPELEEQQFITRHIETECTRIDIANAETRKLIDLLTEYRTALISEVVTGKIKVTE